MQFQAYAEDDRQVQFRRTATTQVSITIDLDAAPRITSNTVVPVINEQAKQGDLIKLVEAVDDDIEVWIVLEYVLQSQVVAYCCMKVVQTVI